MHTEKNLPEILTQIKTTIGVSLSDLSGAMGISRGRCSNLLNGRSEIRPEELIQLSNYLDLNINLILSGNIDYVVLGAHLKGEKIIPKRYAHTETHFSRSRGIKVIHEYVKLVYGENYADMVFSRLQLMVELFEDLEGYVSPLIGLDLLEELRFEGFSDEQFIQMGFTSSQVNSRNLSQSLTKLGKNKLIYENFSSEILPHYDKGFIYQIEKLTDSSCVFTVKISQELSEGFRTNQFGSRPLCLFKQGVLKSFSVAVSRDPVNIFETKCLYHGDNECRYHITWN